MRNKFQFPNGSIKRGSLKVEGTGLNSFQFPNGSIKREATATFTAGQTSFNSLMVRLKAACLYLIASHPLVSIP